MIKLEGYEAILSKLAELNGKEIKKAQLMGVRRAIAPLTNATRSNLRKSGLNYNTPTKYGNKLIQDIKSSTKEYRKSGNSIEGHTYINPSGMLKWFEMGTYKSIPRKTRKSYTTKPFTDSLGRNYSNGKTYKSGISRGSITGKFFLQEAFNSTKNQCISILDEELGKAIMKIWERRQRQ